MTRFYKCGQYKQKEIESTETSGNFNNQDQDSELYGSVSSMCALSPSVLTRSQ